MFFLILGLFWYSCKMSNIVLNKFFNYYSYFYAQKTHQKNRIRYESAETKTKHDRKQRKMHLECPRNACRVDVGRKTPIYSFVLFSFVFPEMKQG